MSKKKGNVTINPSNISKWQGFEDIDLKYIEKIETRNYNFKNKIQISHWYYNNLSLCVYVSKRDDLYLLECIETRTQCESDSDYDSDEATNEEDEITVTKTRKKYYLTKLDLVALFDHVKTKPIKK